MNKNIIAIAVASVMTIGSSQQLQERATVRQRLTNRIIRRWALVLLREH